MTVVGHLKLRPLSHIGPSFHTQACLSAMQSVMLMGIMDLYLLCSERLY